MGSLKGKFLGGIMKTGNVYTPAKFSSGKKYLFLQRSGKLCPHIQPKGHNREIVNSFENWQVMT